MNVVDSNGWLEYLAQGPNAGVFEGPLRQTRELLVPTVVVTEVRRRLLQQAADRHLIDQAISGMRQARVVPLDFDLAVYAATLGTTLKLPLADSIILATARSFGAVLWTQDADFEGLEGVKYYQARPKKK
jgi:predicted nucleic acid-binding protein